MNAAPTISETEAMALVPQASLVGMRPSEWALIAQTTYADKEI